MSTWRDISPGDMPVGTSALADKIAALSQRCDFLTLAEVVDEDVPGGKSWEVGGIVGDVEQVFEGQGRTVNAAVNAAICNLIGLEVSA
jgi:hypothetical protein